MTHIARVCAVLRGRCIGTSSGKSDWFQPIAKKSLSRAEINLALGSAARAGGSATALAR